MNQPTQIIILGGSGDLSKRKLIPALLDLFTRNRLPEHFNIIGLARTERTDDEYRDLVKESIMSHKDQLDHSDEMVQTFCKHISYVSGSFDDKESYEKLKFRMEQYDAEHDCSSNRLFYLAVPPKYYDSIFDDLHDSGAANTPEEYWTHILVEKPFGHNLETAKLLDHKLASLFKECQIFRIDHYLAKEAVQNILSFRFANRLLATSWDKDSISSVEITMKETVDVGHRSGFYEDVGALRDVGQNHLLQLLALVAMREPEDFNAESVRLGRVEALEALRPIPLDKLDQHVLRAQYEGYREGEQVHHESETETYFEMKAFVDLPEWEDVPFIIKAGKALDEAEVSITINFHDVASGLFNTENCNSSGNQIKLNISPEQIMSITLNAKAPGLGYQLESRTLSFNCSKGVDEITNSYEKVLFDSIIGDQTLFTRTEEVLASWKFITPILENWHSVPLETYAKGSAGPNNHIS